ncbi:YceI family protein [Thalassobellus sediminis]|uniref:YceI family protein n=1 Tax=Thalassobellus sediminis TaxID=3367753 RepID=UPI0037975C60
MQKIILTLVTFLCLTVITEAQNNVIKIDTTKSVVKWTGSNLFKYNKHNGTVRFLSGEIIKSNGTIIGGSFVIDMNSIINTDGKYNEMLVSHLKSKDFFDVNKHAISKLKILKFKRTSATDVLVEAELTIKGITNYVDFKSKLNITKGRWGLTSKFFIDRTLWDVKYESKGLFGGLKDDIISDAIEFEVILEWSDNDDGC